MIEKRHPEDFEFFVAVGVGVIGDGWFHGQQCDHLQQVVLQNVADTADTVVEPGSAFRAERRPGPDSY